jgi:signal transduction histidine kinase
MGQLESAARSSNGYVSPSPDQNQRLSRQTLLALAELGQTVTSSLELDDVLRRVLIHVSALLNAEGVAILLPEGEELVFVAVEGEGAARLKGSRIPIGAGVAGHVMNSGEPVWLSGEKSSVPGVYIYRSIERVSAFHSMSLIAVPLQADGKVIGVLEAAHSVEDVLRREDLDILEGAANWAAIAIHNAQLHLQAQAARHLQAQLEERARLARDLHDAVTQSLYGLVTLSEAWCRRINAGTLEPDVAQIAELGELGKRALREARLLVYELQPLAVEEEGLLGALYHRLESVERRAGIQARLRLVDECGKVHWLTDPEDLASVTGMFRLGPEIESELYRIAQEALNNALKHADATEVDVCLCLERDTVALNVQDNGRGIETAGNPARRGGYGLTSMRQRAERLGGRLNVSSSAEGGTLIRAEGIAYTQSVAAISPS